MNENIRIDISKCLKVADEFDIPGNFTSVRGEFKLPTTNKTAFYKEDDCTLFAGGTESIRELLASEILEILNIPHAEITLAYDSQNKTTGCLSHSILRDNEYFIEDNPYKDTLVNNIEEYVNNEINHISRFRDVTDEMVKDRQKTVLNYIYINSLLGNCDIKPDNMQLIYNSQSGQIRSAECYDFGTAFLNNESYIGNKNYEDMMEELFVKYYSEIKELAEDVKEKLTPEKLDKILSKPVYQNAFKGELRYITNGLNSRIQITNEHISRINSLNDNQILSEKSIDERCSDISVVLKDKVKKFFNNLLVRKREEREK